jgi:HSP20 family protein
MTLAPFRGFCDMQSEVERLFNGVVSDLLSRRREGVTWERLWAPRLEAFAREGDLVIHDDLPGVVLDDVDITLEGTTLTISGERKLPAGDGVDYYLRETPSAVFRRSVVPEGIDPDSIKARLESGVLELVLPGALAEIQPKKIALDGLSRSLAAVGEALGVSRERARQLESAALCELRERRRELGLEGLAA